MHRTMFAFVIAAIAALGCAPHAGTGAAAPPVRAWVPMSYMRRFDAPRDAVFRATAAALNALGYAVTVEAAPRMATAPRTHGLARVGDDLVPATHALVLSVHEAASGVVVVMGYQRTFVGERETTAVGTPNPPAVQQRWSRVFAEIDSNLR